MAQPYDPKKAETFNKLVRQGLSEDAAAAQAGISDAPFGTYSIGDNGQMGATIAGSGRVAGVDYDKVTAADVAESNRFNQGLASSSNFEKVDYAEDAKSPPGKVTPINYVKTSTEEVSGGGSTNQVSGPRVPNATSQSIQPAINTKQAEVDQFIKDNPSDFARKKQGLAPLSAEEKQQRQEKLDTLTAERGALKNTQTDAESTTPATTTTVPNTTTTTQTVTTGTASTRQEVDPEADQKLSQENETQLDANSPTAANASTVTDSEPVADGPGAGAGRGFVNPPVVDPDTAEREPADVGAEELGNDYGFTSDETAGADPTPLGEPAPVENPPYDDFAGVDEAVAARAAEPVDTPLTAAQQEAALDEAVADATPSAEDVDAANDKSLQDIEDIRAEAETAPGGVTFPSANNDPTSALKAQVKSQGTLQSRYKQPGNGDWRVRLSLAPNSDYLYNASGAGILGPLTATNGVIFPYTPTITTTYTAEYAKTDLIHSNYRGVFYKSSSVGDVQIRATFTAQDTREAAYLLAVIHFFRSVTKMFYGQDAERGTPPPLVYLSGYGDYQFSNHSCVVTSFNYSLPNEVDYIRTNAPNNFGPNMSNRQTSVASSFRPGGVNFSGAIRLANALLNKGALPQTPAQNPLRSYVNNTNECTYVPTKMEIDIVLTPVQTRSQVSKQFSLEKFATGQLLKGGFW